MEGPGVRPRSASLEEPAGVNHSQDMFPHVEGVATIHDVISRNSQNDENSVSVESAAVDVEYELLTAEQQEEWLPFLEDQCKLLTTNDASRLDKMLNEMSRDLKVRKSTLYCSMPVLALLRTTFFRSAMFLISVFYLALSAYNVHLISGGEHCHLKTIRFTVLENRDATRPLSIAALSDLFITHFSCPIRPLRSTLTNTSLTLSFPVSVDVTGFGFESIHADRGMDIRKLRIEGRHTTDGPLEVVGRKGRDFGFVATEFSEWELPLPTRAGQQFNLPFTRPIALVLGELLVAASIGLHGLLAVWLVHVNRIMSARATLSVFVVVLLLVSLAVFCTLLAQRLWEHAAGWSSKVVAGLVLAPSLLSAGGERRLHFSLGALFILDAAIIVTHSLLTSIPSYLPLSHELYLCCVAAGVSVFLLDTRTKLLNEVKWGARQDKARFDTAWAALLNSAAPGAGDEEEGGAGGQGQGQGEDELAELLECVRDCSFGNAKRPVQTVRSNAPNTRASVHHKRVIKALFPTTSSSHRPDLSHRAGSSSLSQRQDHTQPAASAVQSLDQLYAQAQSCQRLMRDKARALMMECHGMLAIAPEGEEGEGEDEAPQRPSLRAWSPRRARSAMTAPGEEPPPSPNSESTSKHSFMRWELITQDPELIARSIWTDLKPAKRAVEKVVHHYQGEVCRLTDVCREMLVFERLRDISACLNAMARDPTIAIELVRSTLAPHHDAAYSAGFRSVVVKFRIESELTKTFGVNGHVCEFLLVPLPLASCISGASHDKYLHLRELRDLQGHDTQLSRFFAAWSCRKLFKRSNRDEGGDVAQSLTAPRRLDSLIASLQFKTPSMARQDTVLRPNRTASGPELSRDFMTRAQSDPHLLRGGSSENSIGAGVSMRRALKRLSTFHIGHSPIPAESPDPSTSTGAGSGETIRGEGVIGRTGSAASPGSPGSRMIGRTGSAGSAGSRAGEGGAGGTGASAGAGAGGAACSGSALRRAESGVGSRATATTRSIRSLTRTTSHYSFGSNAWGTVGSALTFGRLDSGRPLAPEDLEAEQAKLTRVGALLSLYRRRTTERPGRLDSEVKEIRVAVAHADQLSVFATSFPIAAAMCKPWFLVPVLLIAAGHLLSASSTFSTLSSSGRFPAVAVRLAPQPAVPHATDVERAAAEAFWTTTEWHFGVLSGGCQQRLNASSSDPLLFPLVASAQASPISMHGVFVSSAPSLEAPPLPPLAFKVEVQPAHGAAWVSRGAWRYSSSCFLSWSHQDPLTSPSGALAVEMSFLPPWFVWVGKPGAALLLAASWFAVAACALAGAVQAGRPLVIGGLAGAAVLWIASVAGRHGAGGGEGLRGVEAVEWAEPLVLAATGAVLLLREQLLLEAMLLLAAANVLLLLLAPACPDRHRLLDLHSAEWLVLLLVCAGMLIVRALATYSAKRGIEQDMKAYDTAWTVLAAEHGTAVEEIQEVVAGIVASLNECPQPLVQTFAVPDEQRHSRSRFGRTLSPRTRRSGSPASPRGRRSPSPTRNTSVCSERSGHGERLTSDFGLPPTPNTVSSRLERLSARLKSAALNRTFSAPRSNMWSRTSSRRASRESNGSAPAAAGWINQAFGGSREFSAADVLAADAAPAPHAHALGRTGTAGLSRGGGSPGSRAASHTESYRAASHTGSYRTLMPRMLPAGASSEAADTPPQRAHLAPSPSARSSPAVQEEEGRALALALVPHASALDLPAPPGAPYDPVSPAGLERSLRVSPTAPGPHSGSPHSGSPLLRPRGPQVSCDGVPPLDADDDALQAGAFWNPPESPDSLNTWLEGREESDRSRCGEAGDAQPAWGRVGSAGGVLGDGVLTFGRVASSSRRCLVPMGEAGAGPGLQSVSSELEARETGRLQTISSEFEVTPTGSGESDVAPHHAHAQAHTPDAQEAAAASSDDEVREEVSLGVRRPPFKSALRSSSVVVGDEAPQRTFSATGSLPGPSQLSRLANARSEKRLGRSASVEAEREMMELMPGRRRPASMGKSGRGSPRSSLTSSPTPTAPSAALRTPSAAHLRSWRNQRAQSDGSFLNRPRRRSIQRFGSAETSPSSSFVMRVGTMLASPNSPLGQLLGSRKTEFDGSVREVESLDQLYGQAAMLYPILKLKVQQWALSAGGMFPVGRKNAKPRYQLWSRVPPSQVNLVRWAALKGPQRAVEKLSRSYQGRVSHLLDVCRQSLVFEHASQIAVCLSGIASDPDVTIVKVNNRFDRDYNSRKSLGYRDVNINLRIDTDETRRLGVELHICEVQLLLRTFAELKSNEGHKRYVAFRNARGQ